MSTLTAIQSAWKNLDADEISVLPEAKQLLVDWEPVVKATVEAGCLAPVVPAGNQGSFQLKSAAPFLKRALNDLRGVWLLLARGYSSQAASVAASLYENALASAVMASSESLAREALSTKFEEIPWPPKKLAQLDARRHVDFQKRNGKLVSEREYEDSWTISYYNYKWLCQIKHPTWQSAFHDAKGTSKKGAGSEFLVKPAPNHVSEDVHVRACILGISVSKCLEASKSFFLSLEADESSEEYVAFEERASEVHFGVLRLMKPYQGRPSPINVLDRSFIKTDFSTFKRFEGEI